MDIELTGLVLYLGCKGKEIQNYGYPVPQSGSQLIPDKIPKGEINFIMLFLVNYYTSRECSNGYLVIEIDLLIVGTLLLKNAAD